MSSSGSTVDDLIPTPSIPSRKFIAPLPSIADLTCDICPYKTRLKTKLVQHMTRHQEPATYQCNECYALFLEQKFMDVHNDLAHVGLTEDELIRRKNKLERRIKKEEPVFIVTDRKMAGNKETLIFKRGMKKIISGSFRGQQLKRGEIITMRTKDELTKRDRLPAEIKACLQCGEVITEELKLSRHITAAHKEVNSSFVFREHDLMCKECKFASDALSVMQVHVQMHLMNLEYQCIACFALFLKEEHLEHHVSQCPKVNAGIPDDDMHRMMIYREENRCPICSRLFGSKNPLIQHMSTIHNVNIIRSRKIKDSGHKIENIEWENYFTDDSDAYDDLDDMLEQMYDKEQGTKDNSDQPTSSAKPDVPTDSTASEQITISSKNVRIIPVHNGNNDQPPENELLNRCHICSLMFDDETSLKNHMMNVHKMKHTCGECTMMYITIYELHRHIRIQHKKHACSFCPYTARSETCLAAHERHHIKSNSEPCSLCANNTVYSNFAMLELHYKMHHEIEVVESSLSAETRTVFYACCVCTYESCDVDDFDGHQSEHARKLKFKCKLCDKLFQRRFSALQHQKRAHSVEIQHLEQKNSLAQLMPDPAITPVSHPTASLDSIEAITNAMNDSTAEKSMPTMILEDSREPTVNYFEEISEYCCEKCFKIFNKYFALKRHRARYHNSTPECKPKSTDSDIIEQIALTPAMGDKHHLRSLLTQPITQLGGDAQSIIAPVTPTQPLIMNSSMPLLEDDNTTISTKVSEDHLQFTCDECPKFFTKLFALQQHRKKIHRRVVTNTNNEECEYTCEICSRTFKQCFALHQHKKKMHPDNLPEFVFDEKKGRLFRSEDLPPPKKRKRLQKHIIEPMEKPSEQPESLITSGARKRKCRLCSEKFSESLSMMRHIR